MNIGRPNAAARRNILEAWHGVSGSEVKLEGVYVPVDDLREDYRRFKEQAERFFTQAPWPCVVLDRVDRINQVNRDDGRPAGTFYVRAAPIDVEELKLVFKSLDLETMREAFPGLPIVARSISDTSQAFEAGVVDMIFSRLNFLKLGGSVNSHYTVDLSTSPTGQEAKYSDSHFFSTARGFGQTNCSKKLKTGNYCFYLKSQTPTPALTIWPLTADLSLTL